ncbi:MAG TPA: hypothetical protein VHX88_20660 [Solirubrobacteraceae bacterium]|nr:hypothetical protein [Solirubrobacteraceae bacterium]
MTQSKRSSRSRKRQRRSTGGAHAQGQRPAGAKSGSADEFQTKVKQAREAPRRARRARELKPERPQPPWHPLPLAELLIIVGMISFIYGLVGSHHRHEVPLFVGMLVIAIGTLEFSLREHLSGYRSHTILLAFLPCVVVHSSVVLIASAVATATHTLNIIMLGVDLVMFLILFRILRLRFLDAANRARLARS